MGQHYVYILGANDWPFIKIGLSKNPGARLSNLNVGCPVKLGFLSLLECEGVTHAADIERIAKHLLRNYHSSGEWYEISHRDLKKTLSLLRFRFDVQKDGKDRGGRPPALDLHGEEWAVFKRMWLDEDTDQAAMCRRFNNVSRATLTRYAAKRGLPAKA